MALTGATDEERIWNYLIGELENSYGTAGLMGNLFAESGLNPKNLQNVFEKKLGYTDETYTAAVDDGSYSNFVKDSAGYGLAQWTYWSRKQNLQRFARSHAKSVGDLEMQLDFLMDELSTGYKTTLSALENASNVRAASDAVLLQFERPADMSEAVQKKRAQYGQVYFNKYRKGAKTMSNSTLVNCTVKSPNHSGARTHKIDRITPHCVVGQLSAEGIGNCFVSTSRKASCNYGIGYDGRVCLIVDEANRSWCSSSNANDQRAITIECASDKTDPYAFTDACYNKLVQLCTDICKRNGLTKVLWFADKTKSLNYSPKTGECVLTVHRWFANKACPGDWMYSRMGQLAEAVNKALGSSTGSNSSSGADSEAAVTLPAVPFTVNVIVNDLNYRSEPSMNGTVKGQTGKGTFTIVEVSNGWGKLKSGAGWIYLLNASCCTIGKTTGSGSTSTAAKSYKVKVTANDLNIRKGPGTNYGTNGSIKDKGVYTIVAESAGTGSTKGWGKLKSGAGWISLDYVTKV